MCDCPRCQVGAPLPPSPKPSQERLGDRWEEEGTTYTVNPTDDEKVVGNGYYLSQEDQASGSHATAVYNEDGSFADTKANRQWE